MSAWWLIAAITAATAVPDMTRSSEEQDIVVVARRLGSWQGTLDNTDGTCTTSRSTGDAEIDAIGCSAMLTCFPRYSAQLDAVTDAARARGQLNTTSGARRLARTPAYRSYSRCVGDVRRTGVRNLVQQRRRVAQ